MSSEIFGAAPSGGTTATGAARLAGSEIEGGYDQYQNLYWARQTLEGKQLRVRLADQDGLPGPPPPMSASAAP